MHAHRTSHAYAYARLCIQPSASERPLHCGQRWPFGHAAQNYNDLKQGTPHGCLEAIAAVVQTGQDANAQEVALPEWRNAVTSVLPCGYATPPRLIDARSTVYNAFNCYIPFLCHTAASSRLFFATAQLPHGRFADAATANVRSGHIAEIHFGMIAFAH